MLTWHWTSGINLKPTILEEKEKVLENLQLLLEAKSKFLPTATFVLSSEGTLLAMC